MANVSREYILSRTCVVTVTYYPDIHDVRFRLALVLCELARRNNINLIVVDDSPDHETVRSRLLESGGGSGGRVRVHRQDGHLFAGKGGALRQGIDLARERLVERWGGDAVAAICFTEPEKVDMMNHVRDVVLPIFEGTHDVVVPTRHDGLFRRTYPIEQYHSETFGNMHLDILAGKIDGFASGEGGRVRLDWLFGPFAFHSRLADDWSNYDGNLWDAQMVPYVRGVRRRKWRIASVTIEFLHRAEMKEQEEGDAVWTAKRLNQLNVLFDVLGSKELSP